jgi:hypothetical protein
MSLFLADSSSVAYWHSYFWWSNDPVMEPFGHNLVLGVALVPANLYGQTIKGERNIIIFVPAVLLS